MHIAQGKTVSIEYTLSLDSGEVIESNTKDEPLVYTHGSGELMPGLEENLDGMKKGEKRTGTLPPDKGYGPHNPEALITIPKDHLPAAALQVGAQLQAAGPKGEQIDGMVLELQENNAIVDFNHPLAGKNINFSLQVLDIL